MIKSLFLAIFLASALSLSPIQARAQVISDPATTAQVEELRTTLIALLTQMIAQLQGQIATLIAQQATTTETLGAVSTKVDGVVANQAVVPAPVPVTPKILSITDRHAAIAYFANKRVVDSNGLISEAILDAASRTQLDIVTNKPLDVTATELYVSGVKKDVVITLDREIEDKNNRIRIYITPNVFSFMIPSPTLEESGRFAINFEVRFETTDGEKLSVKRSCAFDPTLPTYSGGSLNCHSGDSGWSY